MTYTLTAHAVRDRYGGARWSTVPNAAASLTEVAEIAADHMKKRKVEPLTQAVVLARIKAKQLPVEWQSKMLSLEQTTRTYSVEEVK